ncbi:hypothetical protein FOZ61_000848 [Perkinsus olseni]|uniref:Uncharacterized protein n=1 Tax=Perkinsus olseni TaxID=32597 RepID=A0A7J6LYY7_PEROL|nr:hypothetical protein FOL46_008872 [Perkinsus olseni]KAF4664376.1 hypothetical protein FOZ61_000848 [Perkinsus olseni]
MFARRPHVRPVLGKVRSVYEKFSKPMGWSDWQLSSPKGQTREPFIDGADADVDGIRKRRKLDSVVAGSLVSVFLLMLLYARNDRLMVIHGSEQKRVKVDNWAEEFAK